MDQTAPWVTLPACCLLQHSVVPPPAVLLRACLGTPAPGARQGARHGRERGRDARYDGLLGRDAGQQTARGGRGGDHRRPAMMATTLRMYPWCEINTCRDPQEDRPLLILLLQLLLGYLCLHVMETKSHPEHKNDNSDQRPTRLPEICSDHRSQIK